MTTNEPNTQRGLACPECGSTKLKVIYTRSRYGAKVVRRRECRECQARLVTWERVVPSSSAANVRSSME